ncbi:1-acyl-sn-glycerol-3-phosphate acyltransferase [Pedobacter glucosidilyticus]|uniref:1-acyl-sn-glycerol-3-phosphate acyltransferase n=1 Tax=Pedobacter glucosidilyticus TaxID=1122941 RepID=UPI000478D78F|nr:1-acyl-sn-glycerol-3-phosphate acyltransferase [Pedobacter glucosidilyticus]
MIYHIFHFIFSLVIKVYFKKIYTHGLKTIPQNQAFIICSNHGNSLLDAILLAVLLPRKIHFLARADVFNSPIKRWFLKRLNMMPVYRLRDGREALIHNHEVFDACAALLKKNGALLIFPEGNCVVEKRLRAFKSGIADLALRDDLKNVAVLPLVIDYEEPYLLQTQVSVTALPLIFVDDINPKDEFKSRKQLLLKSIHSSIAAKMLIIPNTDDDSFYEFMFELSKQDLADEPFINRSKEIITNFEIQKEENQNLFLATKNKVEELKNILSVNNITLKAFRNLDTLKVSILIFTLPMVLMGFVINYLPSFVVRQILKRIKDKQFISAVRMVSATFIYVIYMMLIVLLFVMINVDSIYIGVLLLTSILHYYLSESYFIMIGKLKLKLLKVKHPDVYKRIDGLKNELSRILHSVKR